MIRMSVPRLDIFRPLFAAAALLLLVPASVPVQAGDEVHQAVRGVRATFTGGGTVLRLELTLANGDTVRARYEGEEASRILRLLELRAHKDVGLFVDLRGKQVSAITIELGVLPPYDARPTE